MKSRTEIILKLIFEDSETLTIENLKHFKRINGFNLIDEDRNISKKAIEEDSEACKEDIKQTIENGFDGEVEIISFDKTFELEKDDVIEVII